MLELNPLEYSFSVLYRPVSTNEMYRPTYGKKVWSPKSKSYIRTSYFRKSDELIDFQEYFSRAFSSGKLCTSDELKSISDYLKLTNVGILLEIKVSLPYDEYYTDKGDISNKDVSNFIKSIEDCIFSNLTYNDNHTVKLIAEKGYNEDNVWCISVKLSEYYIHNKLDIDINVDRFYYEDTE